MWKKAMLGLPTTKKVDDDRNPRPKPKSTPDYASGSQVSVELKLSMIEVLLL